MIWKGGAGAEVDRRFWTFVLYTCRYTGVRVCVVLATDRDSTPLEDKIKCRESRTKEKLGILTVVVITCGFIRNEL